MSKDLEDSTEKLLGSQRKRITAQRRQGVKGHLRKIQEAKHSNQFRQALSITHHQANQGIYWHGYLLTWFGTFLPLDEWLDTNQAQRNGLTCKNPKISSKWSKAKEKSRRITRNETNQSQKSVPKDMGNGSTQPINKAWPLKKEAGLNTVMQWQSTGSSRKRQRLNTTDARACKSSNSPKMLNLSQYAQLPMSAALNLSTPPG